MTNCWENYRPVGPFLCEYKCPEDKFIETRKACIPKIEKNFVYFASSLSE